MKRKLVFKVLEASDSNRTSFSVTRLLLPYNLCIITTHLELIRALGFFSKGKML